MYRYGQMVELEKYPIMMDLFEMGCVMALIRTADQLRLDDIWNQICKILEGDKPDAEVVEVDEEEHRSTSD